MSSEPIVKILGGLLLTAFVAMIGMAGYWVTELTSEVKGLRKEVTRLAIAVEVQAGGNPFEHTHTGLSMEEQPEPEE